ncbi:MAG: hypothetical protein EA428_16225 [Spirochaetaceae bacterium]|nr:MAG: hypothetical protein EA428_16225 [Spirochaetaceae bacterium]
MFNYSLWVTDYIHDLLRRTSRTFALSIERLPQPLRTRIGVAYLLFRVSDYLEDNYTIPAARKAELLCLWDHVLAGRVPVHRLVEELKQDTHDHNDPECTVAHDCAQLIRVLMGFPGPVRRAIVSRLRKTTRGMARWQLRGVRVETEDDLDDYMHYVAGVVGYLVTDLFANAHPLIAERRCELLPLSRECGLGLQSVNVIRGLKKDYERGWIYVPRSFCSPHGIEPADLFEPEHREQALLVVGQLVDKAERHLRAACSYVERLPRRCHRIRLSCMWPMFFAAATLAATRGREAALTAEVKISRAQVAVIVAKSVKYGWRNGWVRGYLDKLLAGSF